MQLNNAGLPGNFLEGQSVARSSLTVTIYERGKRARTCEFGVWSLDTSKRSFRDALALMSEKLITDYGARPIYQRFLMRLGHKHHEHQLRLMAITDLITEPIPNEDRTILNCEQSKHIVRVPICYWTDILWTYRYDLV